MLLFLLVLQFIPTLPLQELFYFSLHDLRCKHYILRSSHLASIENLFLFYWVRGVLLNLFMLKLFYEFLILHEDLFLLVVLVFKAEQIILLFCLSRLIDLVSTISSCEVLTVPVIILNLYLFEFFYCWLNIKKVLMCPDFLDNANLSWVVFGRNQVELLAGLVAFGKFDGG